MTIYRHSKKLADISKSIYENLNLVKEKFQDYLNSTSEKWNINSRNKLEDFVHIFIYLGYLTYLNPKDDITNEIITADNTFHPRLSSLFLTNEVIPSQIKENLIKPILREISRWDPPKEMEIKKKNLFFGLYLQRYSPKTSQVSGSVYTPFIIIKFMIHAIDYLLKHTLNVKNGLRNTNFPYKIVDPAAGTMNFISGLLKYINLPKIEMENLLLNIFTMELSNIPYLIGMYEISSFLDSSKKYNFHIGNSLLKESFNRINLFLGKSGISIILGNPPYYLNTQNNFPWIRNEITHYKQKLNEKNLKILSDDYVKFIRLSHKLFQENKRKGIIAFITNNNYLDGPLFKIMRKSLMRTFNEIYVVNLHGNFRKNETGNPFNIKVGVCIIFLVKTKKSPHKYSKVYYWGLKSPELTIKYQNLTQGFNIEHFVPVKETPDFFFIPRNYKLEQKYHTFLPINEFFILKPKSGIMTGRDSLVSNPDQSILEENITLFFQRKFQDLEKLGISVKKTKTWDPKKALRNTEKNSVLDSIIQYNYRGFVKSYLVYDKFLIDGCRRGYLDKLSSSNPAICVTKSIRTDHFSHALVVQNPPEKCFLGTKDSSYVFPLYQPQNLEQYNIRAIDKIGYSINPESLFYYIYAVLYAPTYRSRYIEQLKRHFPHIPFPKNGHQLIKKMSLLGEELMKNHLESKKNLIQVYKISNSANLYIKDYYYDYSSNAIFFGNAKNALKISNINPDIWEFEIGGIKQLSYWLKSRKFQSLTKKKKKRHIGLSRPISKNELNDFLLLCSKIRNTLELLPKIDTLYKLIDV